MKKNLIASGIAAIAFIALAPLASAHEHDTFKIGNKYYLLTVGSLNEPVVVDGMSGVDFRAVQIPGPNAVTADNMDAVGTPVTGLESTLKVELSAGDKKEVLPLDPADTPGSYTADFIPTVQTTYNYRIFGTLNGTPVDLTFSCVPGAVSESAEDSSQVTLSGAVTRTDKLGAFSCPEARSGYGFPEPALSSYELNQNTQNAAVAARSDASSARDWGIIGFAMGAVGLITALSVRKKINEN